MPSPSTEKTPSRLKSPVWINAHCDGGARGNPGPAGYGAVVTDEAGATLAELSEFLGFKTNNFAEYSGLLGVLQWALDNGHKRVRVTSDSELMVKQIQGKYKVNSPDLKPLWEEAKWRISKLDGFQIVHALRHKNRAADRLANEAMDRGMKDPNLAVDFTASLPRTVSLPAAVQEAKTPSAQGALTLSAQEEPAAPPPVAAVETTTPASPPQASDPVEAKTPAPVTKDPAPEPLTPVIVHEEEPSSVHSAPASDHKNRESQPPAAESASRAPRVIRGVCRDGVIHIIDGERLSNGTFVSITVDLD